MLNYKFKQEKQPDTLKTALAIVGAIVAVAGIAVAVTAIIKKLNKKLSGTDDECFCDECCGECCCDDCYCDDECAVEDPVTVVSEGREVTDETESGESI